MLANIRFWLFKKVLKWHCEYDLDQWEFYKLKTRYGYCYLHVSREKDLQVFENSYIELK